LKEAKMDDIGVDHSTPMDEAIRKCHEALTRIRTTRVEVGMHTFGEIPEGDRLVDLITTIIRYDKGDGTASPRECIASAYGIDIQKMLSEPDGFDERMGMSNGAVAEWIDRRIETVVRMTLKGMGPEDIGDAIGRRIEGLSDVVGRIRSIAENIEASDEIGSLKNAFDAGYVRPGPSGYMTRGREDILPTGRNFYSLDPKRVPTTSAWRVGTRLADALIDKYLADEGRYPESVAFQ
ncbi:MAG: cobaltochelatase subunit CobN, partial [Candidatus Methanomethylophilaceae archaeon]|nr:cobaltochelatase subunit CobN [Candidatus Methanomethylophilaceae archaeon]